MSVLPRPPDGDLAGLPPSVLAYLAALEALVVAHEARIAALEARLRQDSSTSSRPPSSDPPGTQAQRRAPSPPPGGEAGEERGRRGGHPGRATGWGQRRRVRSAPARGGDAPGRAVPAESPRGGGVPGRVGRGRAVGRRAGPPGAGDERGARTGGR